MLSYSIPLRAASLTGTQIKVPMINGSGTRSLATTALSFPIRRSVQIAGSRSDCGCLRAALAPAAPGSLDTESFCVHPNPRTALTRVEQQRQHPREEHNDTAMLFQMLADASRHRGPRSICFALLLTCWVGCGDEPKRSRSDPTPPAPTPEATTTFAVAVVNAAGEPAAFAPVAIVAPTATSGSLVTRGVTDQTGTWSVQWTASERTRISKLGELVFVVERLEAIAAPVHRATPPDADSVITIQMPSTAICSLHVVHPDGEPVRATQRISVRYTCTSEERSEWTKSFGGALRRTLHTSEFTNLPVAPDGSRAVPVAAGRKAVVQAKFLKGAASTPVTAPPTKAGEASPQTSTLAPGLTELRGRSASLTPADRVKLVIPNLGEDAETLAGADGTFGFVLPTTQLRPQQGVMFQSSGAFATAPGTTETKTPAIVDCGETTFLERQGLHSIRVVDLSSTTRAPLEGVTITVTRTNANGARFDADLEPRPVAPNSTTRFPRGKTGPDGTVTVLGRPGTGGMLTLELHKPKWSSLTHSPGISQDAIELGMVQLAEVALRVSADRTDGPWTATATPRLASIHEHSRYRERG